MIVKASGRDLWVYLIQNRVWTGGQLKDKGPRNFEVTTASAFLQLRRAIIARRLHGFRNMARVA